MCETFQTRLYILTIQNVRNPCRECSICTRRGRRGARSNIMLNQNKKRKSKAKSNITLWESLTEIEEKLYRCPTALRSYFVGVKPANSKWASSISTLDITSLFSINDIPSNSSSLSSWTLWLAYLKGQQGGNMGVGYTSSWSRWLLVMLWKSPKAPMLSRSW